MRLNALLALLLVVVASATTPKCGKERWSIKTGTDSGANNVDMSPKETTIKTLVNLAKPSSLPSTSRIAETELQTFKFTTTLIEYKHEADDDYHLVIQDNDGNTMIVEIPLPECVEGEKGPFYKGIKNARDQFDAVFQVTGTMKKTNTVVTITGVGFFDHLHGQTGVAPNGIELHPILDIAISADSNNLNEIRAWDQAQNNHGDVEYMIM